MSNLEIDLVRLQRGAWTQRFWAFAVKGYWHCLFYICFWWGVYFGVSFCIVGLEVSLIPKPEHSYDSIGLIESLTAILLILITVYGFWKTIKVAVDAYNTYVEMRDNNIDSLEELYQKQIKEFQVAKYFVDKAYVESKNQEAIRTIWNISADAQKVLNDAKREHSNTLYEYNNENGTKEELGFVRNNLAKAQLYFDEKEKEEKEKLEEFHKLYPAPEIPEIMIEEGDETNEDLKKILDSLKKEEDEEIKRDIEVKSENERKALEKKELIEKSKKYRTWFDKEIQKYQKIYDQLINENKQKENNMNNNYFNIFEDECLAHINSEDNLHSENDKPALIFLKENRPRIKWYKNGLLHRDGDKPAELSRYSEEWYQNGKLYRDNNKPSKEFRFEDLDEDNPNWYKEGFFK
jgi:hypothetical protein